MRLIRNYRAFVSGIGIGIGSENTENAHNRAIENKIRTIFCFLYKKEKKHCLSLYYYILLIVIELSTVDWLRLSQQCAMRLSMQMVLN